MYKSEEKSKISCPIFQKQERAIKAITDKINMSKGMQEKARFAEELQEEVDVLLSCPGYEESMLECKDCRLITNLRKKTANLIIKAKRLA